MSLMYWLLILELASILYLPRSIAVIGNRRHIGDLAGSGLS